MAEDDVKRQMSDEEIAERQAQLLEKFCQEKGWDPEKLDARQLLIFFETPAMKELLSRKYKRS